MKKGELIISDRWGIERKAYFGNGYQARTFDTRRSMLPGYVVDNRRELDSGTRTELMRKARYMKKQSGLSRSMGIAIRDYAIGPGIFPIPLTEDDGWNEAALQWFTEWAKICDVSGKLSYWEIQRQRAWLKFWDGDSFTLQSSSAAGWAQLQLIRAHNCGNFDVDPEKKWVDGVQLDRVNRPRNYRFRTGDDTYVTIPAPLVRHSHLIEDPDQVRGVTCLFFALNNEHDVHDLLSLEKDAVKNNARIARIIYNESGEVEDEERGHFLKQVNTETTETIRSEDVYGAEIPYLKNGSKMEQWTPDRPSSTFTGFLGFLGRMITQGTGMPFEFVWERDKLKGPSQRGVLDQVDRACDFWRQSEIRDTSRDYVYALGKAIDTGELPPIEGWWRHECVAGAPRISIDKGRDAREDRENIKTALDTFKAYYARQGKYWKTEIRQRAKEARYINEVALEFGIDRAEIMQLAPNDSGKEAVESLLQKSNSDDTDE